LSSADWTSFNGRVPSTRTLTINGTSFDLSANRSWTVSADNIYTANGTLTADRTLTSNGNRLTFLGGKEDFTNSQVGLTLQGSATNKNVYLNLKNTNASGKEYSFASLTDGGFLLYNYTDGTNVFTYTPSTKNFLFNAAGSIKIGNAYLGVGGASLNALWFTGTTAVGDYAITQGSGSTYLNAPASGNIYFTINNGTPKATLTAAGRLLLGTTTESTFLLDVNGTARVRATGNGGNDGLVLISQNSTAFVNIGYNTLETNQPSFTAQRTSGTFSFIVKGLANVIATTSDAFDGMNIQPNNVTQSFKIGYQGIQSTYQDIFLTRNTGETSVGINSTTTFSSAVLHASSTTKGFLPPRMTTTQKNAISSPAAGLQVYDTTLNQMSYYNGTTWVNF
jgi:hypothetical protein